MGPDTLPLPPFQTWHLFETDIDRIVYQFLPGWFYLMKCALHFATKLNSRDNKKRHCFLVHSYDLFTSARKALFFLPNGDKCPQITKHVVISVRSKLPQKKFNSPFWTKFWTPPPPIKNSRIRPCSLRSLSEQYKPVCRKQFLQLTSWSS